MWFVKAEGFLFFTELILPAWPLTKVYLVFYDIGVGVNAKFLFLKNCPADKVDHLYLLYGARVYELHSVEDMRVWYEVEYCPSLCIGVSLIYVDSIGVGIISYD